MHRRGAHKDGLDCNRRSTQDITGSRIRHNGSKFGIALLRRTEVAPGTGATELQGRRRSAADWVNAIIA